MLKMHTCVNPKSNQDWQSKTVSSYLYGEAERSWPLASSSRRTSQTRLNTDDAFWELATQIKKKKKRH